MDRKPILYSLVAWLIVNLCFASEASAKSFFNKFFGRCGIAGEATVKVKNGLDVAVFVSVEKDGALAGSQERDLAPGADLVTGICNRDGIKVKVFTPTQCGRTLLSESRFSRVYDREFVTLTRRGFKFAVGDVLDVGSRIAGFALTYIAAGYGVPPEILAAIGVNEAEIVSVCQHGGVIGCAASIYSKLPSDLRATIKADRCLSAQFQAR